MSAVGGVRVGAGVAAFYVVCLIAESAAKCNNVLVADCIKTLSSQNAQPDKFLYTKEERQGYCQDLQSFLSCLEETGCQRMEAVEPVYVGFKNALNFTCSEENHQHEELATCWEWNGFQDAQQFCYKKFGNRSEVPSCDDRNNAISCMVSSVDKCCGKESAAYVKKSATLLLEPSFTTTNCELSLDKEVARIVNCTSISSSSDLSDSSGPNVGLIVVIVFVVVVVVVVIVVVIIVRKSGSRQWLSM